MSVDRPEFTGPIILPASGPGGGEWRFTAEEQDLLGLKPGDRLGTGIVGQPVEPTPPQPSYAELLAEVEKLRGAMETIRVIADSAATHGRMNALLDILAVIERAGVES